MGKGSTEQQGELDAGARVTGTAWPVHPVEEKARAAGKKSSCREEGQAPEGDKWQGQGKALGGQVRRRQSQ